MSLPALIALTAAAGYLAGSLPFGYLTARFVAGIDIRKEGSGNIGATNIGRVLGVKWGILVLFLDCLKGLLPVLVTPWFLPETAKPQAAHLQVLMGMCTVLGHMFPMWLRFRGGKGVATALGVVIAIGGWSTLAAFLAFVASFALLRIVSFSSILAAATFGVAQMVLLKPHPFAEDTWSTGVFSLLVPALILWRHRANIGRLLKGEEKRFSFGGRAKAQGGACETASDVGESGDA
jgi:acyl phosphate:glycerol-3-phosphate acyltransferase